MPLLLSGISVRTPEPQQQDISHTAIPDETWSIYEIDVADGMPFWAINTTCSLGHFSCHGNALNAVLRDMCRRYAKENG